MVSAERIGAELRKMLPHPRRARAVAMLRDVNLLNVILPEANVLEPSPPPAGSAANESTWENTLGILERLHTPTFRTALAALLWGIHVREPRPDWIGQVGDRWRLSGHERKGVQWMLTHESTVRQAHQLAWHRVQRVLREPGIDELLTLVEAIVAQRDDDSEPLEFCRRRLQLPREQLDPPPLITGDDLQRAGYAAGPPFRDVLEQVRDAQLDGRISTPEQALQMAADILRPHTSPG